MSPNPACEYCGAPLAPNASACDACGQPVPAEARQSQEVPQSYIEPPQPEAPSPPQPAAEPIKPPPGDISIPPQPTITTQAPPLRQNNCLRFALIIALILFVICCCILIGLLVIVYNIDVDSLMGFGVNMTSTINPA